MSTQYSGSIAGPQLTSTPPNNGDEDDEETMVFRSNDYVPEEIEFECMERWLDEHPEFSHNYFIRKAKRHTVDDWLMRHVSLVPPPPDSAAGTLAAGQSENSPGSRPNSGANTPVRKISSQELDRGNLLNPMVSTIDGTPTFLAPVGSSNLTGITSVCQQHSKPKLRRRSRSELKALDEKELMYELVKDTSEELDVTSLCFKILQNVCILLNADCCSLFLVQYNYTGDKMLVSKLFDVSSNSSYEGCLENMEEIHIAWGTGIIGYVAKTGESLNIPDAYQGYAKMSQSQEQETRKRASENPSENTPPQCSFGLSMKSACHRNLKPSATSLSEYEEDQQTIFKLRANISLDDDDTATICRYHELHLGEYFESKQTKCCDIFKKHKKKAVGSHKIDLTMAMMLRSKGFTKVVPGWKLCRHCDEDSRKLDESTTETEESEMEDIVEYNQELEVEEKREKLNETLSMFDVSPLKTHGLQKRTQFSLAQEKLERSYERQTEAAAEVFNISSPEFSSPTSGSRWCERELVTKANDHDRLLDAMKEKLENDMKTSEKIQLMTLAPESWSRKKVSEFFKVSEYIVREARVLKNNHGILSLPDQKKGRGLSQEVIDSVKLFYEDDEFSRMMPGGKDFVSIGNKVHVQKRLLLCNLNELHVAYKNKYPDHKVGLSKFCELRPKWCVTVSSSGSHSVCVCTYHQNTKLLVDCFVSAVKTELKRKANESQDENTSNVPIEVPKFDITYKDLMAMIVCDTESLECMVHRCSNCPGYTALEKYVRDKFTELEIEEEMLYSQWENVDRTTLRTHTADVDDFIDLLVYSVDNLTTHSFTAKSQAQYLKQRKENISNNQCIILLDFAENYHYIVQDEIQGYHWNKDQCTLHPVVIYFKGNDGTLQYTSLCIISDDLEHDTCFVHQLQRLVVLYIKENLPQLTSIEYFSDGCGGQYKNFKAFLNLCHHQSDFGLAATWTFFATSHGKSPCDGIGGTVKRKVLRASLQRPVNNQILTFRAVEEYCRTEIHGIIFIMIDKEDMVSVRAKLNDRFKLGDTVPGTRSCHHFTPTSQYTIEGKQLSVDDTNFIDHSFLDMPPPQNEIVDSLKCNDYITCIFDGFWWLALIEKVNREEKDITCKFLHPHGPSTQFHWPRNKDRGYIPFSKVIMKIQIPSTSANGRTYLISEDEKNKTQNYFERSGQNDQ